MRLVWIAVALVATGCAGTQVEADAPTVCDEAVEVAAEVGEKFRAANQKAENVRPAPVPAGLSTTVAEGEFSSARDQAEWDAHVVAREAKSRYEAEARDNALRWATVVDQNPTCFDVETRATAGQVLSRAG